MRTRSTQVRSVAIVALWALRRVVKSKEVADNWICASVVGIMIAGTTDSILLVLAALMNGVAAWCHYKWLTERR